MCRYNANIVYKSDLLKLKFILELVIWLVIQLQKYLNKLPYLIIIVIGVL